MVFVYHVDIYLYLHFLFSFLKKLLSRDVDLNLPITDQRIRSAPDFPYNSIIAKSSWFENGQFTLLHSAAAGNHISVMEELLKSGASVDGRLESGVGCYLTPLIVAVDNGNMEAVKILIDNGANIDLSSRIGNALDVATCREDLTIIEMLINSSPTETDPCRCGRRNSKECQIFKGVNKGREFDFPLCEISPPITQRE